MAGHKSYNKRRRKKQRKSYPLLFLLLLILGIAAGALQEREAGRADGNSAKEQQAESYGEEGQTGLEVHYIDVGQGDATLIMCGSHAMLIDAGDNSKGTAVQLYLKKQGIEKLDYLIGTHPDADHIGGLDVIITKFDCDRIIMPEIYRDTATYRDVVTAMEYRGYENTPPVPGTEYLLGDASFTIVSPDRDYGEDYNNASVGLLLKYGNTSFLFTGDAEEEAEKDMLQNKIALKADVLKVGHHGSASSCSPEFLDAVQPSYAVISCGRDNDYGHPHQEVLEALKERDIQIFRTDELGSIVAVSDGKSVSIR